MIGPAPCVRFTWRRFLFVLIAGVGIGTVVCLQAAGAASAQTQLTLADFDSTGLDADLLALIETGSVASGNWTLLYQASPGVGSLVDGELGVGSSNSALTKIEWRGDTVNDLRVQNGSDLNLSAFLGSGGSGADLTLRVQTADGTGTGAMQSAGASVARWDMDAGGKAVLDGLSGGDRLIVALTRAGSPPAQVTGVNAAAASDTSIDVSWDVAARADGYRVEWGTTSGTYTHSSNTTDTSHTITGLTANTTYHVRVVSTRKQMDDGDPSAEVSATTLLTPPAQVSGVNAAADGHDRIAVSWGTVPDADGYVVEWDDDSGFGNPSSSSSPSASHTITGLDEETAYYVRVRATRTGAPDGPTSEAASATTNLQPPAQVTGVSAQAASDTEIVVAWDLAVRAGGYRVEWGAASGVYTWSATTTALSHTVSDLSADTGYHFRVTATRAGADDGPPSDEADARTNPAPPPGPVSGVSAEAISDSEIQVRWNAEPNSTGYVVQWDVDAAFPDPDEATVVGTGVIIEFLRAETEYFVRVYGTRAGAADGPPSAADSATTDEPRIRTWTDRVPGGEMAAQLMLIAFAGVFAGVRFKGQKSPRREAIITGVMSLAALILPAFGMGNSWLVIGAALLVFLCSIAVIFAASRR